MIALGRYSGLRSVLTGLTEVTASVCRSQPLPEEDRRKDGHTHIRADGTRLKMAGLIPLGWRAEESPKPPGTERPSPSMASSLLGCNATAGSERALVPAPPPPSGSLHLHSIAHLCWCGRARPPVSGAASGQPSLSARCTQRALALYPSFSPPIPLLSLSPRLLRVPSPWPSSLPRLRDSLAPRALARPVSLARLPAPPAGLPAPPPPCCPRPVTNDALGELGRVAAAQSAPASKGRGVWLIWRAELAVGM